MSLDGKWIEHKSGSERTEKGSATLCALFLLHDREHETRARLQVRQIERLGIETGQNGNEGDGRLAHKRVFVIFELEDLGNKK